jgi:hypothetical protein
MSMALDRQVFRHFAKVNHIFLTVNTLSLSVSGIDQDIFSFLSLREDEFPRFGHVLLDNQEKIHYIHNSCSDIDFVNCRKDQVAVVPCSGSPIMR